MKKVEKKDVINVIALIVAAVVELLIAFRFGHHAITYIGIVVLIIGFFLFTASLKRDKENDNTN